MKRQKVEIVTFKADASLLEAMRGVPNRSEFIRTAVLHALQNICPLCKGTGLLTPNQRRHWESFAQDHRIKECAECHEFAVVCARQPARKVHGRSTARTASGRTAAPPAAQGTANQ